MEASLAIITINYNNAKGLIETVESVVDHLNDIVQFIIVDGASTDGSVEYLSSLNHPNIIWISEKDEGIYDAMHKGALLASNSSFLWWLNSGDKLLVSPVEYLTKHKTYQAFFFSQHIRERGVVVKSILKSRRNKICFYPNSVYWHQGFIINRDVFFLIRYNSELAERADLGLMTLSHLLLDYMVIDIPIASYSIEGLSNKGGAMQVISYLYALKRLGFSTVSIGLNNFLFILKWLIKPVARRFNLI